MTTSLTSLRHAPDSDITSLSERHVWPMCVGWMVAVWRFRLQACYTCHVINKLHRTS